MSFFDETKNFGLMAMIAGLVMILSSILEIVDDFKWGSVGLLISGLLLLVFGLGAYQGESKLNIGSLFDEGVTSKFGIVVGFIIIIGLVEIIQGVFAWYDLYAIVVGILLVLFGALMKMDLSDILKKIIWVVLLIIFLVGIIYGFLGVYYAFDNGTISMISSILTAVAFLLIYIMLFLYMLAPEVKSRLAM